MENNNDTKPSLPADPEFIKRVDLAFVDERANVLRRIEMMHRHRAAFEYCEDEPLIDDKGQEEEYVAPEHMETILAEVEETWRKMRLSLVNATTARGQMDALFDSVQGAFNHACRGSGILEMSQFLDGMMHNVAKHYQKAAQQEEGSAAGNVVHFGVSPKDFFDNGMIDIAAYSNLTVSALSDIDLLMEWYEDSHGRTGEDAAYMPYDHMYRRYHAARNIEDPEDFDVIPDEHREEFQKKLQAFYHKELFAPFADVLPKKPCPEMAWFIGAAVIAIQEQEEAMYQSGQNTIRRIVDSGKKFRIVDPDGTLRPPRSAAHPPRDELALLKDPVAMKRMRAMIADVFDEFPEMNNDRLELLDAMAYFEETYMAKPDMEVAQAPGR